MQIFKSAQIKLTSWYLAIIMLITLSFSTFVYMAVSTATERALDVQRRRVERYFLEYGEIGRFTVKPPLGFPKDFNIDALLEIRERTYYFLIILNIGVFVVSGTLGYFLAGKTLKPISEMILHQKRFISDAAHELKTPLTAMKTNLEVAVRDKSLSYDDSKTVLTSTIEEIDKLDYISNQLLQKSKYQNSLYSKVFSNVDLSKILNSIADKLYNTAKQKNVTIVRAIEDIRVYGNKEDLEMLFGNLVDNAIKYSNNNGVVNIVAKSNASVSHVLHSKGKRYAEIKIIDKGIGIAKEDLPNIFEPFYRAEKSRNKSNTYGYGLGLSIVNEIVGNHKGKITVTSKVNKGTIFTVILPKTRLSV